MNLRGAIEDRFPRVELSLAGRNGRSIPILFIVDTAFDGEFALPASLVARIYSYSPSVRQIMLANGEERDATYVMALLPDRDEEQRVVEVLVLENHGNPLLGIDMLAEHLLTIEMATGGEVTIEPL